MKISEDGIQINQRFFYSIQTLVNMKVLRGLQTFTREYGLNRRNLQNVQAHPDTCVIKPEWLTILVRDFDISPEWLLTGRGKMFKK